MAAKTPLETMRVDLPVAASPGRVAELADFLQRALDAADDGLSAQSVTMVVNNFDMHTELRARTARAAKAVRAVGAVISDPVKAARSNRASRKIAEAISKNVGDMAKLVATVHIAGKKATFDEAALSAIRGIATQTAKTERRIRGTTTTYSRVLRVGREKESSSMHARIEIAGHYRDVQVDDAVVGAFLESLRTSDLYRIGLSVEWTVEDAGDAPELDARAARAISIEPFDPIAGDALLDAVHISEEAATDFLKQRESDA